MEYLEVKCHRCENSFHLYNRDMSYGEKPPMCPHCLIRMDKTQWERLIDAYFTFAEVNKNFRKYHEDRGEPLFQVELLTEKKYVKPQKIVLDDGFAGQAGAGTSMEDALKAMEKPLADIVRNPVPNRNIADYE
ncbi:MAG: hypothetical protein K2O91_12820 [Lachnospiraceae bacterium]|nr:hypothetical protein [Lachnospiraceae bacterium]